MGKNLVFRKTFLKGELYTTNKCGLIVMCTETTCNYTSTSFKGVVIEGDDRPTGHYQETWQTLTFVEYKKET